MVLRFIRVAPAPRVAFENISFSLRAKRCSNLNDDQQLAVCGEALLSQVTVMKLKALLSQ